MNKIEMLPKTFEYGGVLYTLSMHVTVFDKLCLCYKEMLGNRAIVYSVCVEPDKNPVKIEDTIGCFNEYIGNARTLDDAADMLLEYINKYINV